VGAATVSGRRHAYPMALAAPTGPRVVHETLAPCASGPPLHRELLPLLMHWSEGLIPFIQEKTGCGGEANRHDGGRG
jgi:hypothetical protein